MFERRRGSSARGAFLASIRRRRTVRDYAADPVTLDMVDAAIEAAATAPSGANRQPWRFVVVRAPEVKRKIREAAEAEERDFYERRAPADWLADLAPLGTDWHKPFLETDLTSSWSSASTTVVRVSQLRTAISISILPTERR
jgi:iodotyrosine deiodinase